MSSSIENSTHVQIKGQYKNKISEMSCNIQLGFNNDGMTWQFNTAQSASYPSHTGIKSYFHNWFCNFIIGSRSIVEIFIFFQSEY